MGWGGRRSGSGRKPKVVGIDGKPRGGAAPPASPPEVEEDADLLVPPAFLSEDAQGAWRRLAPLALRERTLTASRTPGFEKLCQEWAYCAALEAEIQRLGLVKKGTARLLKQLVDHKKLLKSSLADFALKSFGKPATAEKPKAAKNPFAAAFGRGV